MTWLPGRLLAEVYDTIAGGKVGVVRKCADDIPGLSAGDRVWIDPRGGYSSGLSGEGGNPLWVVPTENVIAVLSEDEFLKMVHPNELARMGLPESPSNSRRLPTTTG